PFLPLRCHLVWFLGCGLALHLVDPRAQRTFAGCEKAVQARRLLAGHVAHRLHHALARVRDDAVELDNPPDAIARFRHHTRRDRAAITEGDEHDVSRILEFQYVDDILDMDIV